MKKRGGQKRKRSEAEGVTDVGFTQKAKRAKPAAGAATAELKDPKLAQNSSGTKAKRIRKRRSKNAKRTDSNLVGARNADVKKVRKNGTKDARDEPKSSVPLAMKGAGTGGSATSPAASKATAPPSPNWKESLPWRATSHDKYPAAAGSGNAVPDATNIWFDDISRVDLVLAYGSSAVKYTLAPPTQHADTQPRTTDVATPADVANDKVCEYVAIDCEMVGVGPKGRKSALGRVSIVDFDGAVILDKYVKPCERVTDYRTPFSGIRPVMLKNAEKFKNVRKEVAKIIKGRILVGHSIKNDLDALLLDHPRAHIRDTAECPKYRELLQTKSPGLKRLANLVLGENIQKGAHCSVEDAQTTMRLYRAVLTEQEAELTRVLVLTQKQKRAMKRMAKRGGGDNQGNCDAT